MKIRELRNKKNLTQKELGERIGESENTISNWERGASNPNIEKLIEMSKIFGVSVDKIVGNVEIIDIPEVQDFGTKQECERCQEKEMIIELLKERIADLKETIDILKERSC